MSEILDKLATFDSDIGITLSEVVDARRIGDITVIVPTRNERDNVEPLLRRLEESMHGIRTTVIFVDDSDDDTAQRIADESLFYTSEAFRPRLVERLGGERVGGLSGAVLAGIAAAETQWVCVMDGDLQHPPALLLTMLDRASVSDTSIVIASRYTAEGSDAW